MKIKKVVILTLIILLFGILIVKSESSDSKINPEVYKSLEKNEEVRVVVDIKEPAREEGFLVKKEKTDAEVEKEKQEIKQEIKEQVGNDDVKHEFDQQIAVEISKEDIKALNKNPDIESVRIDKPITAFLQDSVPLINASNVWNIKISNLNITGIYETVCIIDTGIDFSHPDLTGRNKTCIIDCVGKACVENCSIGDDNGHGTHVAGIVAAYGGIKGVAIQAGLIGVKILNSAGSGSGSDLDAGIDWCIDNANTYNISVISMSLGTDCDLTPQYCYSYYCDSVLSEQSTALRIDNATSRNISVIVATGNDGNIMNISSPACVKNATAVGATDKSDNIASYSNRNNLTDLVAPGSNIYSTKRTSGYETRSGTSMSAPHVAGAFALVRQFFKLQYNRPPTTLEILSILNSTGKQINDTAGNSLNYSRVDVYSGIFSIDSLNPNVTLESPANGFSQFDSNVSFNCSANDVFLSNITLYVWNSSDYTINTTLKQVTGINARAEFNLSDLSSGDYKWNCLAYDHRSNSSLAGSNYSFSIKSINVSLLSPNNNVYINRNTSFNCSAETLQTRKLSNATFFLWNSGDLIYNFTRNITGLINSTSFNYNFTVEANYSWNCKFYNNYSESYSAVSNNSIIFDTTKPNISLISPSDSSSYTSNSQSIDFSYNISDNYNIASCSLIINNAISLTNSSINKSQTQMFTQAFSPGSYSWRINCTDLAENTGNSSSRSFTVTAPVVTQQSTGGGGGGGGSTISVTYIPSASEVSNGYTKELNKDDKIKFNFFDAKAEEHILTVNEVKSNSVSITIRSSPVNLILGIGQSARLNFTSKDYYDLYIKLESIENTKARLTIQLIHELIPNPTISTTGKAIETANKTDENEENEGLKDDLTTLKFEINKVKILVYLVLIIFIIAIFIVVRIKTHKKKEKLKEYKEVFKKHVKPKKNKIR